MGDLPDRPPDHIHHLPRHRFGGAGEQHVDQPRRPEDAQQREQEDHKGEEREEPLVGEVAGERGQVVLVRFLERQLEEVDDPQPLRHRHLDLVPGVLRRLGYPLARNPHATTLPPPPSALRGANSSANRVPRSRRAGQGRCSSRVQSRQQAAQSDYALDGYRVQVPYTRFPTCSLPYKQHRNQITPDGLRGPLRISPIVKRGSLSDRVGGGHALPATDRTFTSKSKAPWRFLQRALFGVCCRRIVGYF